MNDPEQMKREICNDLSDDSDSNDKTIRIPEWEADLFCIISLKPGLMDPDSDEAARSDQRSSSTEQHTPSSPARSSELKRASVESSNDVADDNDYSTDADLQISSLKNAHSNTKSKQKRTKKKYRFAAPTTTWRRDFHEGRYRDEALRDLYAVSLTGQLECFRYFFDRQTSHGRQFLPGNRLYDDIYYLDLAFIRQLPVQIDRLIPGIEFQEEMRLRASDLAYYFAEQQNCSVEDYLGMFDYGALLALGLLVREFAKNLIRPVLADHFYKPIR